MLNPLIATSTNSIKGPKTPRPTNKSPFWGPLFPPHLPSHSCTPRSFSKSAEVTGPRWYEARRAAAETRGAAALRSATESLLAAERAPGRADPSSLPASGGFSAAPTRDPSQPQGEECAVTGDAPLLPEADLSPVSAEDVFAGTEAEWGRPPASPAPLSETEAPAASQTYSTGPPGRTHEPFPKP